MAAPGVSVTAHLPTIEHVSPQVLCSFHFSSFPTHPFLSSLFLFPSSSFLPSISSHELAILSTLSSSLEERILLLVQESRSCRGLLELASRLVGWLVGGGRKVFVEGKERRNRAAGA